MDDMPASDEVQQSHTSPNVRYAPVRVDKFIVLSLLTFGLYHIVWFYRNWRYIRDAEDSRLWPWARALFAPLWYYGVLKRLGISGGLGLALAYLFITGAWRLPDPYWLVSVLSFVALLPAVVAINDLNAENRDTYASYGWRKRSVAVAAVGIPISIFAALGTLGPSTAVVAGSDIRESDLAYLRGSGILAEDEQPLFFYSPGFLSIHGEGVLASDQGITSYWTDLVSEQIEIASLAYGDIEEIESNPSSGLFGDTWVRVTGRDGS